MHYCDPVSSWLLSPGIKHYCSMGVLYLVQIRYIKKLWMEDPGYQHRLFTAGMRITLP